MRPDRQRVASEDGESSRGDECVPRPGHDADLYDDAVSGRHRSSPNGCACIPQAGGGSSGGDVPLRIVLAVRNLLDGNARVLRHAHLVIGGSRTVALDPVSANSLGAAAAGMAERIGSIAPGMQADIIALDRERCETSRPFGSLCS